MTPLSTRRFRAAGLASTAALALVAASLTPQALPAGAAVTGDPIVKLLYAAEDSYSSTREPNWSHGTRHYVYATTDETHGLVKFNTARLVPAGYEISKATLRVRVRENNLPDGSPVVRIIDSNWYENNVVLANAPSTKGLEVSSPIRAGQVGHWVDIPLNASRAINPDADSSFAVSYSKPYSNFRFDSKESGAAPQLEVTLAPSGPNAAPPAQPAPAPAPAPALGATVPAPAATAGFNNLVLRDEFDNLDNFDLTGTGQPDKLWYTDRAFGYGRLPASDLSVNNGVLTLDQTKDTLNYGFASVSPTTRKGRSYQYGYFEIRMAHDPSNSVRSKSYPSFWSVSRDHLVAPASKPMWSELNFYEAYHEDYKPYPNFFVGTVHDWRNGNPKTDNMSGGNNTYTLTNVDYTQMHVYSCLWMPGKIVWYFDGRPLLTQLYGPNEYPTPNYANNPIGTFNQLANETNGMALILGTGINNPMRIDYVRVWK